MLTGTVSREAHDWPALGRIGFRFLCAYLALFTFPGPIGYLPFSITRALSQGVIDARVALSYWTQIHVLGIASPAPFAFTGSADTMERYATHLNFLLLATLATIVWTLLDRRRRNYAQVADWLRAWLRLNLATIIFGYGFAKVFPTQFGTPSLSAYAQPLGEFSPMGLLWVFMGSSTAYSAFAGALEVLGGVCLLFRRTATLGALILIGAMSNVAMLNFAYDVPVKLFSLHLILMAVVIAAPDMQRLVDVLVLNRATVPQPVRPLLAARLPRAIAVASVALFVGYIVWSNVSGALSTVAARSNAKTASPLYGIYEVEDVRKSDPALPPLLPGPTRWRQVVFDAGGRVTIRTSSDIVSRYNSKTDPVARSITLTDRSTPAVKLALAFEQPGVDQVVLNGSVDGDAIVARLRRVDESKYLLLSRGFNWIQERPFNR
jgi:uncharacterized membrane protein YphA (DoxX/SURF4 family)